MPTIHLLQIPEGFFKSLEVAAKTPFAFVAYIILVLSSSISYFKLRQLKIISNSLKDLPENQRRAALTQDGYYLDKGMSSKDYFRTKKMNYIFLLIFSLLLAVVIISVVIFTKHPNSNQIKATTTGSNSPIINQSGDSSSVELYYQDSGSKK